ncbi:hypothetical protein GCM10027202_17650 [Microvirgula curvata]|uniref:hypothetical protein n=1 Tax=Microvirgula sp. AG722 TaxID=2183901 RepID=UPI000DC50B17|nr:hypothetical protein [Microvirgula sp. AG722]RAS14842.1 hypothetical protein DFO50_10997 [Microvirgula sp. AG722]
MTTNELTHALLPAEAIARLQRAARVEPSAAHPDKRMRAIDTVTEGLRRELPSLFREDDAA